MLVSFGGLLLGVLHRRIDGDEFFFLTNIHRAANNEPLGVLQTAHTHLFGWLAQIDADEITKAEVGRFIWLAFWPISLALLYRLGTRLLDPLGAMAAVAFFALFSFSVAAAAEFRIDGILLPVLLSIALLLLDPATPRVAAAGGLSAVAVALSIKASLWAPAFIGVLAIGLKDQRSKLKPLLAGASAATVTFGIVMFIHYLLIVENGTRAPNVSPRILSSTASRMMLEEGLFPKLYYLLVSIVQNPVTWMFLVIGLYLTLAGLRGQPTRKASLLLLALSLPILSVAFYANAFPYAYLILFPTACLLAGRGFSSIIGDGRGLRGFVGLVCLIAAAIPMAKFIWDNRIDGQVHQKQILSVVHDLFEEPVPYIDGVGMVASFPRSIFPMSAWGFKGYKERGAPALREYIETRHPPLLVVNTPALDIWDSASADQTDSLMSLLPEDREAVRATYAHYWSHIYLAGRQWRDADAGEEFRFEIIIPGEYTLFAQHPVIIDGQTYEPGSRVSLQAGRHQVRAILAERDIRLLWGRATEIPSQQPSPIPLFSASFGKTGPIRCLLPMSLC